MATIQPQLSSLKFLVVGSGPLRAHSAPMRWLLAFVCLGIGWQSFAQPANPENILLEGYTFTRPSNWQWEAPGAKSASLSRFVIPGKDGKILTDVGFFYVNGVQEDLKKRVIGNFDKGAVFSESSIAVGKTNLIYVRVYGTATVRKSGPLFNYELVGTMLPSKDKDKWFFARLFGPRAEVHAAEGDFKKMIAQAVEDSSAE